MPGIIEMLLGDRLLFSAHGTVDLLPMAETLFTPQSGAWQMGGKHRSFATPRRTLLGARISPTPRQPIPLSRSAPLGRCLSESRRSVPHRDAG